MADSPSKTVSIIGDSKTYFRQTLKDALDERKIATFPFVESYLVEILEHYILSANLYEESQANGKKTQKTLAETMLMAASAPPRVRFDLLKGMGDRALYISGFFGDSLQRKIVDIDYYMEMGASAYASLSKEIEEDTFAKLYHEIAHKFNLFVDAFHLMSRKTIQHDSENIMRLMEVYSLTGSGVAQDILVEKGIFTNFQQLKGCKHQ